MSSRVRRYEVVGEGERHRSDMTRPTSRWQRAACGVVGGQRGQHRRGQLRIGSMARVARRRTSRTRSATVSPTGGRAW